jgi:hypothetical protein
MRNKTLHCKACDGQLASQINFLLDDKGELCNTCYMDILEELLYDMLVQGAVGPGQPVGHMHTCLGVMGAGENVA